MILKSKDVKSKKVGPMKINEYKINKEFSAALIEISGVHGKLKCLHEDRIYFIIQGKGKFIINEKEEIAEKNDLIFIQKNTPYDIIGNMKYLIICSPAFNPKDDISLEK